ncbi:MAG: hypothetical protein AAF927_18500 [Bacteroidota bacterium]
MKPFCFIFALLLLQFVPTQAQELDQTDKLPTYSNDLSLSFTLVQAAKSPFRALVANPRIMYRRHLGAFAFRAQVEGLQYDRDLNNATNRETNYAYQKSRSAMFGGQYSFEAGRFGLYGFLDLGYGQTTLRSLMISRWTFENYEEIRGIKGQAGLGLEFRFAKRWHLGLESAATYIYGKTLQTPNGVQVFDLVFVPYTESRAGQWLINPINAFWIGYSFGEAKN